MSVCLLKSVGKSYRSDFLRRESRVLEGISFQLEPGETLAYLGHNGAGKTTTIKMLLGLLRPEEGEIRVFGEKPGDPRALARLGYLPENPYFYDHLSGREFLALVADLHRLGSGESKRRIGEVLELVGMEAKADQRLRSYSKGMLQRIGLGQALLNDPELLILDEPMGGLDPVGRHQIRSIISELKIRGKTIFMSSHILGDVEALADRAAILGQGRMRRILRMTDLVADNSAKRVECRGLRSDAATALEGRGFTVARRGDVVRIEVENDADLPDVIGAVVAGNGSVLRVVPLRGSLEDVFLQEIGRSAEAGGIEAPTELEPIAAGEGRNREGSPHEPTPYEPTPHEQSPHEQSPHEELHR